MTFSFRSVPGDRRDGMSLNSMVILSFLLHALILSILFLSPSLPAAKWTFGPVYTVDLVSFPARLLEQKSAIASTEKIFTLDRNVHSTAFRKKSEPSSLTPEKRPEAIKKPDLSPVDDAIRNLEKKIQSPRSSARAEDRVSPQGTLEISGNMRIYYAMIWSKIKDQWALPEGILPGDDFEAVVGVKIRKDGTVYDIFFEKPSGNRYFDESVLKAIKKASPFPEFPESLREETLDMGIRFLSSEMS